MKLLIIVVTYLMNLMAGHRCPIGYRFSHKARVDVDNGRLTATKAALSLSRRLVHALLFEVGLYFRSLTTTKPISKEALIFWGHQCPAIRFICPLGPTLSVIYGNHVQQGYDCLGIIYARQAIKRPIQLGDFLLVHIWLYLSITLIGWVESFSCTICQQVACHKSVMPYDSCYEFLHTWSIPVGCPTEAKLWLVSKIISEGRANNLLRCNLASKQSQKPTIQNIHTQNVCVLKNNPNCFYWEQQTCDI